MYAYPHPQNPALIHPANFRHAQANPLTRKQKIALGVGAGVAVLGVTAAIILIPRKAKAQPAPPIDTDEGKRGRGGKPAGSPPPYGDACFPQNMGGTQAYDNSFWDAGGTVAARQRIFDAFQSLGYSTPTDRSTMNDPGPDAALGGGDDIPNAEVRRFQKDYNGASRRKVFANMGGLWEDGFVGPCTLNGVKYVLDQLAAAGVTPETWPRIAAGEITVS